MRQQASHFLPAVLALILAGPAASLALNGTFDSRLIAEVDAGLPFQPFNEAITLVFTSVNHLGPIQYGLITSTVPDDDPTDDFYGIGDGYYIAFNAGPLSLIVARTNYDYFPSVPSPSTFQGISVDVGGSAILLAFGDIVTYCGNATFCIQSEAMLIGSKH